MRWLSQVLEYDAIKTAAKKPSTSTHATWWCWWDRIFLRNVLTPDSSEDATESQSFYSCQKKMRQSYLLWIYCSFSISLAKHCRVTELQSLELPRFHHNNSTNVLVSWSNEDCASDEVIKITAVHLRYLGCQRFKKDFEKKEILTDGGSSSAIIENLHHYSEYRLEVCPESRCPLSLTELQVTTKASVPGVRAVESLTGLYDYRDTETSLTFNWRPPASSECQLYHSVLGGYHYELIGVDQWNEYRQAGSVPLNQTKVKINNLNPFSRYNLFVYVTNSDGKYHQDFFLKLEKKTRVGQPSPPLNLSISETDGELTLFWRTPQHPSGELRQFEISRRNNKELQINRNTLRLEETEHSKDIYFAKLGRVEENIKYFFKIRSYNKDYDQSSDWSIELEFQILETKRSIVVTFPVEFYIMYIFFPVPDHFLKPLRDWSALFLPSLSSF